MTRPTIWRSSTARAHDARLRRSRDANALAKLAEAYDRREAEAKSDSDHPQKPGKSDA